MAVITPTLTTGTGQRAVTETTLGASDTLTYTQGSKQLLRLRNVTGGALTVTLTGSASVSQTSEQGGTVNYAAGYSTGSIAATTGDVIIPLDSIPGYLQGTVTVTGGTGIKASLLNQL
jgi:hypothetical protein